MAALVTNAIVPGGLTEALVAASGGGDTMTPGNRTFLKVNNGSGSSITVTITCQVPCSYGSGTPTHDLVVTVVAGAVRDIGFVDPVRFGRSSDGQAVISYSAVHGDRRRLLDVAMDGLDIPEGTHVMYKSNDHVFVLVRDSDGEVIRTVKVERAERQVR